VVKAENAAAIYLDSPDDAFDNRIASSLIAGEPAIHGNGVEGMEILSSRIRGYIDEGRRTVVRESFFPGQGHLDFGDQLTLIDSIGPEIDFWAGPGSVIRRNSFLSFDISHSSRVVDNRAEFEIRVGSNSEVLMNRVINGDLLLDNRSKVRGNHVLGMEVHGGGSLIENNIVSDGRATIYQNGNTIRWNSFDSLIVVGESNVVRGNSANHINGSTDSPLFGPIIINSPSGAPSPNNDHPGANFVFF